MKNIFQILLITLALTASSFSQILYPVKFEKQDSTINIEESCILKIANGDLLLFWHESYVKKIFYSRSTDSGTTWLDKKVIAYNVDNFILKNDIDAIVKGDGTILFVYRRGAHYLKYSTNNGINWSDSIALPTRVTYLQRVAVTNPKLNLLSNGKIALIYNYRDKGIFSIYSNDGINWTPYQTIDESGVTGSIIPLNDNRDMLFYSDSLSNYWNLVYRISTDTGKTWFEKQILLPGSFNDINPRIVKDPNDKIWLFFEREDATYFPQFTQSEIYFITSTDNGVSWSQPEKFTNYAGMDFNHSVTLMNDIPLLSFASTRSYQIDKNYSQIFYSNQPDVSTPPFIYNSYHEPLEPQLNEPVTIRAYTDDDKSVDSVKIIIKNNVHITDTLKMHDDGTYNDSLAGDKIYGAIVEDLLKGDAIQYDFLVYDDEMNVAGMNGSTFYIPLESDVKGYCLNINRFILPINDVGIIAHLTVDSIDSGRFDEGIILFSGGFYLSGKNGNNLWGNGVAPTQRIQDYNPGIVGSFPDDPKNQLYVIKTSDPHFGESWQNYKYAVMLGADFYDGDKDGTYNPVDLNGNGIWDLNEDKPDIIGDVTAWCVYNDNVLKELRRFPDVDPLGIEIHQTAFAWGDNLTSDIRNIIFFRYRIHNKGTVSTLLDSVYFGIISDPDIGDINDDLVGIDSVLNSALCYNDGSDETYGTNPPAFSTVMLQGPNTFITGETFIDINSNGTFDTEVDTPLDTAYNNNGLFMGSKLFPGAKNLDVTSFVHFQQSDPYVGDPDNSIELRNYMLGKTWLGDVLDPCNWHLSEVHGGVDCNLVNPFYWYSGDPVSDIGWINTEPSDQRMLLNSGPFNLEVNKPVDIIVAYLGARGTSALNSVTEARKVAEYAHSFYKTNFTQLPSDVENEPTIPGTFALYQNYPNPFNPSYRN